MAIDRDFLAEKVWQNSMIPRLLDGAARHRRLHPRMANSPTSRRSTARTRPRRSSPKLGYGPDKPLKMEIRYNTSENHKNTAVAIQEQLKPLGIEVTLLNTDTKTHYGHLEQKGDFDVARAGWIADYKDPENFLGISARPHRQQLLELRTPNTTRWLKRRRRRRSGQAHEASVGGRSHRACRRPVGNIPLLYYSYKNVVSSKLSGWDDNVMDVHPTAS
jgi:oligopeptide transport system substrate-binding protein